MTVRHDTTNSTPKHLRIGTSAVAIAVAAVPIAAGFASASASAAPAPSAPSGSVKIQKAKGPGVKYTRYRTASAPGTVTAYYAGKLKKSGYALSGPTTTSAESVVYGRKGKSYAAVQASGANPTYFEVCVGSNRSLVNTCDSPSGAS